MGLLQIRIGNKAFLVKDCRGLSSLRGLMFDKMEGYDGALIRGNDIWMPFVRRKLKLIFLDKDMKVLSVVSAVPLSFNWKTWKTYSNSGAKYCLELKNTKLKLGKGTKVFIVYEEFLERQYKKFGEKNKFRKQISKLKCLPTQMFIRAFSSSVRHDALRPDRPVSKLCPSRRR